MVYSDIEKQREWQRNYARERRRKRALGEIPNYLQEALAKKRRFVAEYKNRPCADCGIIYPAPVMEFDHVRGEKVATISKMLQRNFGMAKLVEEIEKCDVVCANCHRLRTWRTRPDWQNAPGWK